MSRPGNRTTKLSTTSRRLASQVIFSLAALLTTTLAAPHAAAEESPPNVVIIFCDDLGYSDISGFGESKFKTPRIEQLAREGAKLTSFYSSCPFCSPARASILTGRYPFHHGLLRNPAPDEDEAADRRGLDPEEITFGELFQQAGYATAIIGKWHVGHQLEHYPSRNGFDEFYGILWSNDERPVTLREGRTDIEYPVIQATLTKRYTEKALDFIERHHERPFLLYLAHHMPHKPLAASEAFYKKSGAGLYGDVMAELDWGLGQVMDKIKSLGIDDNTLVIFTSDHGPWFGGSCLPLRGMKGQCYEGGVRVPMIVRWPGKIPAGHVSDEPGMIMDIFTTSLQVAGIEIPQDRKIDGRDIMPLLTSDAKSPHEVLFFTRNKIRALRAGKWKLHAEGSPWEWGLTDDWIDHRGPDGVTMIAPYEQAKPSEFPGLQTGDKAKGTPLLFDLEADPSEQHNVADQHPEVVARLMQHYETAKAGKWNEKE